MIEEEEDEEEEDEEEDGTCTCAHACTLIYVRTSLSTAEEKKIVFLRFAQIDSASAPLPERLVLSL